MTIQQHPSPNYGSRYGWKPDRIVNHITAGSTAAGALATLCDPKREASAHFVIDKDGHFYSFQVCRPQNTARLPVCAQGSISAGLSGARTSYSPFLLSMNFA